MTVRWSCCKTLHSLAFSTVLGSRSVPESSALPCPVNADIHEIDTIFVEEEDKVVNPLGVKGMGELGMVGIPAAIVHATGRRVRALPITPDKVFSPSRDLSTKYEHYKRPTGN